MKGTLEEAFRRHVEELFPDFLSGKRFLLAFSGGLDSVVLGNLMKVSGISFDAAHCNFHLRGDESLRDERFAAGQAVRWGVKLLKADFDTAGYARRKKISIEMAARELRYGWFAEAVEKGKYAGVVTAHHGDDQVETVLLNLTRGTSLDGLLGMAPRSGPVLRPLLPFSREELAQYARQAGLEWMEDSTNALTDYTRNKLRHQVLPVLKEINPSLVGSLYENTGYLRGVARFYGRMAEEKIRMIRVREPGRDKISLSGLSALGEDMPVLLYEILRPYGLESRTGDVARSIVEGQSGAEFFSEGFRMLRDRDFLIVEPVGGSPAEEIFTIPQGVDKIDHPVEMTFRMVENTDDVRFEDDSAVAYFDADLLGFPLELRLVRPGDAFCPIGMGGQRKKVSKFLKDEKVSVFDKQRVWLLCTPDGRIAWVVGRRASEEFRVTGDTCRVLVCRVER